jgi:hypothetical protein
MPDDFLDDASETQAPPAAPTQAPSPVPSVTPYNNEGKPFPDMSVASFPAGSQLPMGSFNSNGAVPRTPNTMSSDKNGRPAAKIAASIGQAGGGLAAQANEKLKDQFNTIFGHAQAAMLQPTTAPPKNMTPPQQPMQTSTQQPMPAAQIQAAPPQQPPVAMSDRNAKTNIKSGKLALRNFLNQLGGK